MAEHLTAAQIWAALATVAAVLAWSNALYKNIFGKNLGETIKASVMQRWFSNAIFKKDVLKFMDTLQLQLNEIKAEVKTNGGSSMKDVVKRLEEGQQEIKKLVIHNVARRDISDLHSDRMIFRMDSRAACFFVNEKFLKDFGWTGGDVLGYGYENIIDEEEVHEVRLKWNHCINRKCRFTDEQTIKDSSGSLYRCLLTADPIIIGDELVEFYGLIEIIEKVKKPK